MVATALSTVYEIVISTCDEDVELIALCAVDDGEVFAVPVREDVSTGAVLEGVNVATPFSSIK